MRDDESAAPTRIVAGEDAGTIAARHERFVEGCHRAIARADHCLVYALIHRDEGKHLGVTSQIDGPGEDDAFFDALEVVAITHEAVAISVAMQLLVTLPTGEQREALATSVAGQDRDGCVRVIASKMEWIERQSAAAATFELCYDGSPCDRAVLDRMQRAAAADRDERERAWTILKGLRGVGSLRSL